MGTPNGSGKLGGQHLTYLTPDVEFTEKETDYLNSRIVIEGDRNSHSYFESTFPVNFTEGVFSDISDKQ
jgi:hypothetical protein